MIRGTLGVLGIACMLPIAVVGAAIILKYPALAGVVLVVAIILLRPRDGASGGLEGASLRMATETVGPRAARVTPNVLRPWLEAFPDDARFPVALGTVDGQPKWLDMATAPHVLVGGATGSGKSVFLHSLIVTGTALKAPQDLRLVLIDPKRVELNRYRALPHVAAYASEQGDARRILSQVETEMDRRYKGMEHLGIRDISEAREPRILVVIDEFADLVLTTRRTAYDVEPVLCRLLALGRAAGVHVVLATQRPDRTVVTGLIKANCPTRVAFRSANAIESRIILDVKGAESLPGAGAGLIMSSQVPNAKAPGQPVRFQGLRIPDAEIDAYCSPVVSPLTNPRAPSRVRA